jgi:predicted Zn-dependent protease
MFSNCLPVTEVEEGMPRVLGGVGRTVARRWNLGLVLVFTALLVVPSLLRAQAISERSGKRVVPRSRDFTLHDEVGRGAHRSAAISIYRVIKTDGLKVWLEEDGEKKRKGWALSDQVVPVDQAAEFFGKQLRVNPHDTYALVMRATLSRDANELDKAITDFSEVIRLDPKLVAALSQVTGPVLANCPRAPGRCPFSR